MVVAQRRWVLGAAPFVIVLLLAGPTGIGAGLPSIIGGQSSGVTPVLGGVSTTLTLNISVGHHLDAPFWGLNTLDNYAPKSQQALGRFLNSTPITWIRLGGGDDGYDPTTATEYQAPASGTGKYVAVSGSLVNFTWFQSWCDSRTPHCLWMTYLPGEENNTAAAVHVAQYFHNVLHFVPTVWEFGNEPLAWTHYGLNRSQWSTTDNFPVAGTAYATMVHNYIAAVTALFPSDKFLGIQNSCACNPHLISTLTQVDGAKLAGVAYHEYPWLNGSNSTATQFFGALNSTRAIPATYAHMSSLVTANCTSCGNLPISIGEYQAGPVPDHSPLAQAYTGAPFMAASVIQALSNNISTFTAFSIGWMFNTSNGNLLPQGYLYQRIFDNMTMGTDYSIKVNAGTVGGVYALLIKNGTRESLLVVNTNSTRLLKLSLTTALFPVGLFGSYYTYASYNSVPVAHKGLLLPTLFSISTEQVLLINNF